MPRPRIDDLAIAAVIEVYVDSSLSLTADQVVKESKSRMGAQTPSLRKVQEILKEHRETNQIIEDTPVLSPLGEEWPKESEQVQYLFELGSRWKDGVQPRWTQTFIDTAFELKGVLCWDLKKMVSSQDGRKLSRTSWELPSPYGESANVAGELAIIGEISNRRIVSESLKLQLPLEDLYAILLARPWAEKRSSYSYSRVMVDGIHGIVPNDIYHESREVERKIWAAERALRHWDWEFHGGFGLEPEEDKSLTEKREIEILKGVNELEAEAGPASRRFLEYLEGLPEVGYVRRYKASLLSLWVFYRWEIQGRPGEETVSREEIEASFDDRSESHPDRWVYREPPQPDPVDDLPF